MFSRRDFPACLLLLVLLLLVMLTLSQILMVHNVRYRKRNTMRRLQLELREMDKSIYSLMQQGVPSIEESQKLMQNKLNEDRFVAILREAEGLQDSQHRRYHGNEHSSRTHSIKARPPSRAKIPFLSPSSVHRTSPDSLVKQSSDALLQDQGQSQAAASGKQSNANKMDAEEPVHYCPAVPPGLGGHVFVDFKHRHNFTEAEIVSQNPELDEGGGWRPRNCTARHRVAIIVPYRDRREHLLILLAHLHPILQRQQLDYRIYVVEQDGQLTFNKARIMNAGFLEALKLYNYHCFVFHDVDLVPEDDRNMYSCPIQPRHMSVAIDEMGYKLAYQELVGGVLSMRTEHFQRVNGYSNLYWGWGAEDDDMAYRIMHVGLKITRPPDNLARYKMVQHTKRKPADWRKRTKLLITGTRRFQFDGLNSLQYKLVHINPRKLYTHVLVDIGKPPRGF